MTTVATEQKLITANELLLMPKIDGRRFELVRGMLVEKMPGGDPHSETTIMIGIVVGNYVIANDYGDIRAGEPGYRLERDPDTVRAPDVAWFAPGRLTQGVPGYPEIVPDLAIEVKSPSNSWPEIAAKAYMWLSYGSRQAWVADPPTASITIYRLGAAPVTLGEDDILEGGDLLPGFAVPVWQLFRRRRWAAAVCYNALIANAHPGRAGECFMTTVAVARKLITAEELLLMPKGDGRRFELVRGVLIERMPGGDPHSEATLLFSLAVGNYARANRYGVVRTGDPGYRLERDPDTVRAPDVAWFAPGRLTRGVRGYPEIIPDLAIEIKSPSNSWPEIAAKAYMWLSYGSRQAWVGDPETVTVRIYRPNAAPVVLGADDILDGGDLLPGFSVAVRDLFLWEE